MTYGQIPDYVYIIYNIYLAVNYLGAGVSPAPVVSVELEVGGAGLASKVPTPGNIKCGA